MGREGGEEESHEEVWMLIFVPVPAGNLPSQKKIGGGGGEGAHEGGYLKLISHSYLDTRGCRSSVKPSWCHSNDGSPSSPLGCEVTIWGQCALSSLSRSLQLWRSSPGLTEPPNIHRKQQNSFRTQDKGSATLLDLRDGPRGISAAWWHVRINANSISKTGTCYRNSCQFNPADQATQRRTTHFIQ